jgi:predicted nucleotide-binding protein
MVRPDEPTTSNPRKRLAVRDMQRGIERLRACIQKLKDFDPNTMTAGYPPEIDALSISIQRVLEKLFGEKSTDFHRFSPASELKWSPGLYTDNYPQLHHYQNGIRKKIAHSIALLEQAIMIVEEDITEIDEDDVNSGPSGGASQAVSRRVFLVHGHEEGPREAVARFLEKIDFAPIILHEQANQGRTIIEKFEAHADVGFAVVLLTPDDMGGPRDGAQQPRVRQNVVLELGYFIGKLGRGHVRAIKSGDLEMPSDIIGVVWTPFDNNGAWKVALAKELKAAGHEINLNKAMRS